MMHFHEIMHHCVSLIALTLAHDRQAGGLGVMNKARTVVHHGARLRCTGFIHNAQLA